MKKGVSQMAKMETSIVINRPIHDVFEVLSNFENNPKWASESFLEVKKTSQGPTGVGTTWRFVQKAFGQRIEGEAEITEYEPIRKSTLKTKWGLFRMTYEPIEGGTQVNLVLDELPGGFFRLVEPLVMGTVKSSIEAALANLKDLMEAHVL
jgi:uncharacterized membrane protein